MGIDSRDYARGDNYAKASGGWSFGSASTAPVCKYLILANIALFLLQIFITRPAKLEDFDLPPGVEKRLEQEDVDSLLEGRRVSVIEEWLSLKTDKVIGSAQVWRLLTCAFLHDREILLHILFNMLFLFWFGRPLEGMYGSREFLLFYLVSALIASCAHIGLDLVTGSRASAIGASGAVMAVLMLYAIHYPRQKILIFLIIPVEIRWLVALYVLFDLHPVLLALAGDRDMSGVGHAAHLGGLAFGFLYWKFALRLERLMPKRQPRPSPSARGWSIIDPPSPKPEPDELDEKVDAILKKITEEGEASLTDAEREILNEAARRKR